MHELLVDDDVLPPNAKRPRTELLQAPAIQEDALPSGASDADEELLESEEPEEPEKELQAQFPIDEMVAALQPQVVEDGAQLPEHRPPVHLLDAPGSWGFFRFSRK